MALQMTRACLPWDLLSSQSARTVLKRYKYIMIATRTPPIFLPSPKLTGSPRHYATVAVDSAIPKVYDAVIAGSGAGGIAALGNVLEVKKSAELLWVDPAFDGGRISRQYRDVSSNTKVKLFKDYAQAVDPYRDIVMKTPKPNAFTNLESLDPNQGCRLTNAADMLQMLTKGLLRFPNVQAQAGKISSASYNSRTALWSIKLHTPPIHHLPVQARSLVLCTGSSPRSGQDLDLAGSSPAYIDLDTALHRDKLRSSLDDRAKTNVAILGCSHSAIVILMNLYELATSTHPNLHITWFTRHGLSYAKEMDGWILRDNTGLKGASADFAREHLEPEKLKTSAVGKVLTRVDCSSDERGQYAAHMPGCTHIVPAIGYVRDPLPELSVDGRRIEQVKYDEETGCLLDGRGGVLPRVYGAGIAFPQRVTDPHGNVEHAVGFWKFMKYLKVVVPKHWGIVEAKA